MKNLRVLLVFFAIVILSVVIFVQLYPLIHPFASIRIPLSKSEIEQRVLRIANSLDVLTSGIWLETEFAQNTPLLRQLQTELGLIESNRILREGFPGYYWKVSGTPHTKVSSIAVGNKTRITYSDTLNRFHWQVDLRGNLLKFERSIPEDADFQPFSESEALAAAQHFLRRFGNFQSVMPDSSDSLAAMDSGATRQSFAQWPPIVLADKKIIRHPNRIDYEFLWSTHIPPLNDVLTARVVFTGNFISQYQVDIEVPPAYYRDIIPIRAILSSFTLVTIAILTIVMAFKRWRAYELSFRFGIGLGIICGIAMGVLLYSTLPSSMGWEIIFPLVFAPLFVGGSLIFVWAVGESLGREIWNDKFISLDLIRHKHWMHSRVGGSILRGIAIGALAIALWLLFSWVLNKFTVFTILHDSDNILNYISSSNPLLNILSYDIYASIYTITAFVVLFMSWVRKYISSPYLLLSLLTLILVVSFQFNIHPISVGVLIEGVSTFLIIWSFYRYDLLTSFMAMFTSVSLEPALSLFTLGHPDYLFSGYTYAVLFLFLIGYAVTTLFTRDRVTDFKRLMPAYVKNITERERLQRELEIARDVQMSFLPKATPQIVKLDIASRCEPALEVGGDYYDFIQLDKHQLGIAIGDVSGKGTQAAFYMTLTKGFLKALAQNESSPARVLSKMNRLFYENVKRGIFISMVYGIFDTRKNTLTLARAGHNPVVMHRPHHKESQAIHSRGIAIGMEKGDVFDQTIQEITLPFQINDLFIFYTDGCTEAMNKHKEEFGEKRFTAIIEQNSNHNADEVLQRIFSEIKKFTGRQKQHDDMTVVVVKITPGESIPGLPLSPGDSDEVIISPKE